MQRTGEKVQETQVDAISAAEISPARRDSGGSHKRKLDRKDRVDAHKERYLKARHMRKHECLPCGTAKLPEVCRKLDTTVDDQRLADLLFPSDARKKLFDTNRKRQSGVLVSRRHSEWEIAGLVHTIIECREVYIDLSSKRQRFRRSFIL
jgi:hypothetical protein